MVASFMSNIFVRASINTKTTNILPPGNYQLYGMTTLTKHCLKAIRDSNIIPDGVVQFKLRFSECVIPRSTHEEMEHIVWQNCVKPLSAANIIHCTMIFVISTHLQSINFSTLIYNFAILYAPSPHVCSLV